MDRTPWGRALIILGVTALTIFVAGQLFQLAAHFGDVIILFFLAWLLAFTLLPLVRFLENRLSLGRSGAAGLVYLVLLVAFLAMLVVGIPLLVVQVSQLAGLLPTIATRVPAWLREIQSGLDQRGIPLQLSGTSQPGLGQDLTQLGSGLVANTVAIASGIASGVFSFTIILILSFYIVLDGDRFLGELIASIPEQYREDSQRFVISIDRSFGGFLRGTAIQAAILGLGTAAIMGIAGLPYILLASIFAALVMVIPFVGPLLALVLPALIALFSNVATSDLLVLLVALVILQLLVMNIVAPKVMSQNIGIHPLLVFLALLVGIKEAGVAGAIFGVPVAAVIYASAQILLHRWQLIQRPETANGTVEQSAVAIVRTDGGHRRVVRLERLGVHVGHVISRLFHAHST
jgi:predicted PurR-regulated permease PerM